MVNLIGMEVGRTSRKSLILKKDNPFSNKHQLKDAGIPNAASLFSGPPDLVSYTSFSLALNAELRSPLGIKCHWQIEKQVSLSTNSPIMKIQTVL